MADSRPNNTPIEIQEYIAYKKRSKEKILRGVKSSVVKAEMTQTNKKLLQPGPTTKDIEIALLFRTAMVGIERAKEECQQIQASIRQAVTDSRPQDEIDRLKALCSSKILELNKRCKKYNDWSIGTPDPTGGITFREIAEDTIIQIQTQLIMEINGKKKKGTSMFPEISPDERELRLQHYREYSRLYRAFEKAIKIRKAQEEKIKNGGTVSKEDIKLAKEAVRVTKEQFISFGRSRNDTVPPARSIYGEIRDTENLLLKSKLGQLCQLRNVEDIRNGPIVDADMYEAVEEMMQEAVAIDQEIKDERLQNEVPIINS